MTWMQTYLGGAFSHTETTIDMFDLQDIAHSESLICRYTGHCKEFFSVAQHSVLCSYQSPDLVIQKWCLFHDAAEPYISDVNKPVKSMPWMKGYCEHEDYLLSFIADKFGLPWPMPKIVKEIDFKMLATEHKQLFLTPPPMPWEVPDPYPNLVIEPQLPKMAEARFLERYSELFTKE